jgi:hypothetical protein
VRRHATCLRSQRRGEWRGGGAVAVGARRDVLAPQRIDGPHNPQPNDGPTSPYDVHQDHFVGAGVVHICFAASGDEALASRRLETGPFDTAAHSATAGTGDAVACIGVGGWATCRKRCSVSAAWGPTPTAHSIARQHQAQSSLYFMASSSLQG